MTGKLNEVSESLTAGGGTTPVPLSATVCGEPVALSAMLSVAESAAAAAGLKVTETVQKALAASDAPQVLVWVNEEAFVPPIVMLEMVSAAEPEFFTVTVCAAEDALTVVEAKARLVGERLAAGADTPVPLKVIDCGVLGALSLKLRVTEKVPAAVGLKVNVVRHEAPAASEPLHELAPWKSTLLLPVIVGLLVKVSVAVPVLVNVTVCEADAAPTVVAGKVRLEGETEAVMVGGTVPAPLSATVCAVLAALSAKLSVADSEPATVGLKVTWMVQDALAASDAPQLLVSENEDAFVPLMVMPEMVSAAVPELESVTDCAAEETLRLVDAKARLAAESLAAGPENPVPARAAVCGEPVTLSAKLSVAESAPVAAGLKVTVTVQEALAASEAPQLLVCENADALAPLMVMPERVSAAVPELASVIVCVAEEAPALVVEKVRLVGVRVACGARGADTEEGQAFTTLATLSEPRPVALS